ncbi:magnesium chelatase domain-containing protein, partial [Kutzneria sp. 744]|uniref:magnesium chelatase domain-containing protein n=1 Tax=Kutzneria sp. (strain 744) TaxID=345341 RepID=UPI0026F3EF56
MFSVHTVSLHGLTGHLLTVTVTVTVTATAVDGPPVITLTGATRYDARDLRDRVHAALANAGHRNRHNVEVNVAPASTTPPPDAAVAAAVLAATIGADLRRLADTAVLGDVGLDGRLRPTRGVLPAVQAAAELGIRRVIVPAADLDQAALVDQVDVLGAT